MSLENTRPDQVFPKKQWIRVSNLPLATDKSPFKGLYIGNNTATGERFRSFFQGLDIATDLMEGKKDILDARVGKRGNQYDVILIDLPYDQRQLKLFCSFLRKNTLGGIVLIYNGTGLTPHCIRKIKRLAMFDDILDFQSAAINYTETIPFFKKSKRAHRLRHLRALKSRSSRISIIRGLSLIFKRALDMFVAITALIILLPLMLIIALIIRLESKGPVFYTAPRAGKGYRIFRFYKFRTMRPNADQEIQNLSHLNQYADNNKQAVFYKIQNDPRVTRFGRFLRNSSLDEIPQFFNVLMGDMSLVGNRPLPLYEAAALTTNKCVERFAATAGITGLWQVKKRGKAEMSDDERINLDITYARKENLIYDLWIMLCTPVALMQKSDV